MTAVCPRCQATLEPGAPEGLCPRCLLGQALPATTPPVAFPAPTPAELAPLFPQLEVLDLLGQGGMGAVYKACHIKLDRLVALKVLPPAVAKDPGFAERFLREARVLAKLQHPHIVGVHDFGDVDGLYYLLMEFVEGVNLRQAMAEGKLKPQQALAVVGELCAALQYAHEAGVVHRDVKPENVLLDRLGRVKVADFGLAKLVGQTQPAARLTGTQQAMGTPHYMAPEQWERPLAVDHRADIYSLGVVFYELLTGELPLGKFAPPSQRAGVDARLDGVVLRAMERLPEQRYQQMSEMKTAVEAVEKAPPTDTRIAKLHAEVIGVTCGFVATILATGGIIGLIAWYMPPDPFKEMSSADLILGSFGACGCLVFLLAATGFFLGRPMFWLVNSLLVALWGLDKPDSAASTISSLSAREEALRQLLLAEEPHLPFYIWVLPDIDRDILAAARRDCHVAPDDPILAIHFSERGDMNLLFGCQRLYWCNRKDGPYPGVRSVSYAELAGRRFVNHGDSIYLGGDLYLCPDEVSVSAEPMIGLLYKVRDLMAAP